MERAFGWCLNLIKLGHYLPSRTPHTVIPPPPTLSSRVKSCGICFFPFRVAAGLFILPVPSQPREAEPQGNPPLFVFVILCLRRAVPLGRHLSFPFFFFRLLGAS